MRICRTHGWWRGAAILLLACLILPAAYSPALAQKPREAKKAQALYEKALQQKSVAERIHLLEQAAELFAEAQSAASSSPEIARLIANIHGALGREFCQQGRWQPAIAHLEKALAFDPGLLPARATLGLAYFQQGQFDAAIQAYDRVLHAQPTAQLYNNLGAAHEAKGDLAAAVAAYSRALELDSSLGLAQKNLLRAQAKFARASASAFLQESAADSLQLTTEPRDSLAVTTANSLKDNTKSESSTALPVLSPRSSQKSALSTQRRSKPAVSKQDAPIAARSRQPSRAKDSARDSATAQTTGNSSPAVLRSSESPLSRSPQSSETAKPQPVETSGPRPSKPSASLVVPVVFGIGALLLAVLAVAHRRRLGHVWLHLKPALAASTAAVSRQVRLLPSRLRNELGDHYEHARRVKLLPSRATSAAAKARSGAESPETIAVSKNEPKAPRQPSLQTQAFFAEMIAAEPEIEEFDEEVLAKPDEAALPTIGDVDHASAEPPLLPVVVGISKDADLVHHSLEPTNPIAERNEHNGEFAMSAPTPESGLGVDSINEKRKGIDSNVGYVFSISWPEEPDNATSKSSRRAAEIPPQRDHEPQRSEDTAAAGQSAPIKQLPASITSQPATSNRLPAASRSASELPPPRDNGPQHSEDTSAAGQSAIVKQLPASITSQPATSNRPPATSNRQPAASQSAAEIPLQRDDDPKVFGRYVVERKIGKGAMGNIYLALDPKLDRQVVIKTVCFNLATSDTDTLTLKDRVYREARAIAKLGHPNIVVVYDVEDDKDLSYIVMEHIEGRDLRQALTSEHRFEVSRAIKIVSQVCSALDYAHQAGIIHRDIKPSNIMLLPGDKAKVTDFGIAKIEDNFSLTLPGHVLGTPSYMAPEQFEGMAIDGRADIFSLGVVFYELVTGSRPFVGNTLASLAYKIVHKLHLPPSLQNVELPLELDEIAGRALAKNPEERYATAMEFREALQALQVEAVLGEVELAQ